MNIKTIWLELEPNTNLQFALKSSLELLIDICDCNQPVLYRNVERLCELNLHLQRP